MGNHPYRLEIVELNQTNLSNINSMDNAFEVKSRIILHIKGDIFDYTIEEVPGFYTKSYLNDELDYSTYIGNPDRTAYLAYINDKAVGQIILRRWWNKFAWVEDIRVESKHRGAGIGTKLMDTAVKWAQTSEMRGIMVETQDTNVPACLFYQKYGFKMGGADKMAYGGSKYSKETALFWYLVF